MITQAVADEMRRRNDVKDKATRQGNSPAFPLQLPSGSCLAGITKRELMATLLLQEAYKSGALENDLARWAVKTADELLLALVESD